MLLERTISQLDIGFVTPDQAMEMGHMGYLQWLGALPGDAGYAREALRAYAMARPFAETSPAVAVFCDLLLETAETPLCAPELTLPGRARRGGARARRSVY